MVREAFHEVTLYETPEQELGRLRRERRELEITVYILAGLIFLIWLARR